MLAAIAILFILFVLNGFFAMSELAMMTSRRARLQKKASRGHKGAAMALELAASPTRFLSTVQVGITLVGIMSGAFAEKAISAQLGAFISRSELLRPYADEISLVFVVLCVTYLSLVIGELVPKRIALAYPEAVAASISRPLAALSLIAAWPVKVLTSSTELLLRAFGLKPPDNDDVSEDDVRSLVARAATTGVFTRQEHALFKRTMQVGDLTVRDLMVPRTEIVWLDEDTPVSALKILIGTNPFSHFPVCKGGLDSLIGVVHIKDLIAYGILSGDEFKASEVAHKPLFVPETMPALKLMDEFKRTRVHIAFVVNEYGAVLGLLTLNDVLAALIGDISRKGEEPKPQAIKRADGSWLIDGLLPLQDGLRSLGITIDSNAKMPDASTVAGLLLGLLDHIPRVGEFTDWMGWRFEVVDMDGSRIDQILAKPISSHED